MEAHKHQFSQIGGAADVGHYPARPATDKSREIEALTKSVCNLSEQAQACLSLLNETHIRIFGSAPGVSDESETPDREGEIGEIEARLKFLGRHISHIGDVARALSRL